MNQTSETPGRRRHPVIALIAARLREFLREPEAIFWVYVFPLVLVVALGVAFRNRAVEVFHVAVQEGKLADGVRTLLNQDARLRAAIFNEQESRAQLRAGHVDVVVVVSGDSGQRVDYYFDPARGESALARDAADRVLQRASGRRDPLATQDHRIDEPGSRYIDFLVPGLVAMGLMGGGLWGVGYAIVDMRIRKLLKRYVATPMRRSHFLSAVIFSRLLFVLPEMILLLLFARLAFGVTSAGGYLAVGVLIVLGALMFSGIGLLVASRAKTIETVSGLLNAAMLPMYIGSGIFFSIERFPQWVQPILGLLPLTPLIHALRGVMLEGISLFSLLGDVALVVAWGCVTFALALRWFRWT